MAGRFATLLDEASDLFAERADGVGNVNRRGASFLCQCLHLARHDRETATGLAGTRGFDARVERQQSGLSRDGVNRLGHTADLFQQSAEGGEALLDMVDRTGELPDVLHGAADQQSRFGNLVSGSRGGLLSALGGTVDLAVARDHVFRGSLEFLELLRLVGHTAADLVQIPGDVRQLDPEGADAACEL
jgi:hypothetical protein